jgi:hypothetical protein
MRGIIKKTKMDLLSGDLMSNENAPELLAQRSSHWRFFHLGSGNWKIILPACRTTLAALSAFYREWRDKT